MILAQLPTPETLAGWESVGVAGFLVAAIMVLLYAFFGGKVVPRQVHEDVIGAERSMRQRAEEESREVTRDLVRLTDRYEQLLREAIHASASNRERRGRERNDA